MGLSITADLMSSDDTLHTATLTGVTDGWEHWQVSWLPGRTLGRSEAISAMQIAQVASGPPGPGDALQAHVNGWAAELGLAAWTAVTLASQPPDDTAR